MHDAAWTAERIDLLKRLWAEGETAAVIAARLGGMSRSAVLGKIFRLRLGEDGPGANAQAKQTSTAAVGNTRSIAPARRRRSGERKQRSQSAPAAGRQYKALLELTNKTCRWPHGRPGTDSFFFRGAPEADLGRGIPYCARHMRRAYPACTIPEKTTAVAASGAAHGGR